MPMTGGTIDISNPLDVTGDGMAFDRFMAWADGQPAENLGAPGLLSGMKDYYEKDSAAIVGYIQGNGEAVTVIHTTDSGLQRVGGVDTQGPGTNKTLTGTIE